MMKKVITIVFLNLIAITATSQVMGVSASKLAAMNGETATRNQVEFEPGFGYFWANKYYDSNGNLEVYDPNKDSTAVFQAMAFRITYGISDRFETGILIASDMSSFSLGMKYNLLKKGGFSTAVMGGVTFANESDIVAVNTGIFGKTASIAIGIAGTQDFSEKLSLDFDLQYQNVRDNNNSYSNDIFANAEFGYRFKNRNQIIGGFSYTVNNHTHQYDGHTNQLLTFNVGGTISSGENFEIVVFTPVAIYGKNYDRLNGVNFALTIFIN